MAFIAGKSRVTFFASTTTKRVIKLIAEAYSDTRVAALPASRLLPSVSKRPATSKEKNEGALWLVE